MNAVIKGAKAGSGEARKAVIATDSAQSKTYIKFYGLSEGEVEGLANGLQSVYLEETPLHNPVADRIFRIFSLIFDMVRTIKHTSRAFQMFHLKQRLMLSWFRHLGFALFQTPT
jgi:hypothetical protein